MTGDQIGRIGEFGLHPADSLRIGAQIAVACKAQVGGLGTLYEAATVQHPAFAEPDDDIVPRTEIIIFSP